MTRINYLKEECPFNQNCLGKCPEEGLDKSEYDFESCPEYKLHIEKVFIKHNRECYYRDRK